MVALTGMSHGYLDSAGLLWDGEPQATDIPRKYGKVIMCGVI
jgi:hypothetical protein